MANMDETIFTYRTSYILCMSQERWLVNFPNLCLHLGHLHPVIDKKFRIIA